MSTSVDDVTAQVGKTTPNDSAPAANDAVAQSAAEGRRLYIGNLAYATTEGELKEFFKAYLIEAVSIPTNPRTSRPVGYAFVDVSTSSEAERAITELNGKSVLERKVSVQLARKPEEVAANGDDGADKAGAARGKGRNRARGGRSAKAGRSKTGESTDAPTTTPPQVLPLTENTNESEAKDDGKAARARRIRGPPEDGVPSKTKIMVANLPYELGEEKLLELFKAYSPTAAKLALRPIPRYMIKKLQARNEPRKGRGFAFVTLASEDLQKQAIAEMNGKEIDGRELAVKVAIDSPGKEDEALEAQADAEASKENGVPAATQDSPAV